MNAATLHRFEDKKKRNGQKMVERIFIIKDGKIVTGNWSSHYHSDDKPSSPDIANAAVTTTDYESVASNIQATIRTSKKREDLRTLELDPSKRKRLHKRLVIKMRKFIDELAVRTGQQAIVFMSPTNRPCSNYRVFGTEPLEGVVKKIGSMIMEQLDDSLLNLIPPPPLPDTNLFELPPLLFDDILTPIQLMTQAQMRTFIPHMLKYSTGRMKPGWGKESARPQWWPTDLPWANIRMDIRSEDLKKKKPWSKALREIIINCYKFHGRKDLLQSLISDKEEIKEEMVVTANENIEPCILADLTTNSGRNDTFNILVLDADNSSIILPDGTIARIEGFIQLSDDSDPGSTSYEASINNEGQIMLTKKRDNISQMVMEPQSDVYHACLVDVPRNVEPYCSYSAGSQNNTENGTTSVGLPATQPSTAGETVQVLKVLSLKYATVVTKD